MSCSAPRAWSGTSSPRSARTRSAQAPGRSATARSPESIARSRSKRSMMCRLYVASSLSMRIRLGSTAFSPRYTVSTSSPEAALPARSFSAGSAHSQKGRPRPTKFSHIRDWLSCTPKLAASASGCPNRSALGRFCSYSPCPVSCIVECSAERSCPAS